jgi:hypothetical protein
VLGIVVALFVTTAGACQREYEGRLPSPDEMGARRFPEGARTDGLDATYARLTREERDGEQCFHLIRLTARGEALLSRGCSTAGVGAILSDDRTWSRREYLGDYAHRGELLWLRIVSWDPLAEEFLLESFELTACDAELRSTNKPAPFMVVHPYMLVAGTGHPGALSGRCST